MVKKNKLKIKWGFKIKNKRNENFFLFKEFFFSVRVLYINCITLFRHSFVNAAQWDKNYKITECNVISG